MIREKVQRGFCFAAGYAILSSYNSERRNLIHAPEKPKEDTTDYTKDWPARYYDIPTGTLRREHLKRAKAEGFAVPADSYREMLCERRFFPKKDGTVDGFFRAWTMIKASAAAGVSFSRKSVRKRTAHLHEGSLSLPG